jgi:hypothetical protein
MVSENERLLFRCFPLDFKLLFALVDDIDALGRYTGLSRFGADRLLP